MIFGNRAGCFVLRHLPHLCHKLTQTRRVENGKIGNFVKSEWVEITTMQFIKI